MRAANLAGCGAILLWSFLAVLSRRAASVPPFQLVCMSFGVSAIVGLVCLAITGRAGELRQPVAVWLHGVGGLFCYHALYFASLGQAPPATANLINYFWPLLLVLLSALASDRGLSWRQIAGACIAGSGCALLLWGDVAFPPDAAAGYALAAGGAVVWAVYSILARRFAAAPVGVMAGLCSVTAMLAGLSQAFIGGFVMPEGSVWADVVVMGLGPVGAAFALWDVGMKRGDQRLLGTMAFGTPVLSTLILGMADYAPFTGTLAIAAAMVAAGGLIAGR